MSPEQRPLFTIGVTTYNRKKMLSECLASILAQEFTDFEVLVGNDYIPGPLSLDEFGISDPRIKILNYEKNIGEHGNMNFLLSQARGKYFTWLADDDLYEKEYLSYIQQALERHSFPPVVLTNYTTGAEFSKRDPLVGPLSITDFESGDYLRRYFTHKLNTNGCYSMFEVGFLKGLGGMKRLGNGFSPYSDNLLAVQVAQLPSLVFINNSLLFFRTHDQSISFASVDVDAYVTAQIDFLSECRKVFGLPHLAKHFQFNLQVALRWCVVDFFSVLTRSRKLQLSQIVRFPFRLAHHSFALYPHYHALVSLVFLRRLAAHLVKLVVRT